MSSVYGIVRAGSGRAGTWSVSRPTAETAALYHGRRIMLLWRLNPNLKQIVWIRRGPYRWGEVRALNQALWALEACYMVTRKRGRYRPVGPVIIEWRPHPDDIPREEALGRSS